MERLLDRRMSRRRLLGGLVRGVAGVASGVVFAACTPDNGPNAYTMSIPREGGVAILTFRNGEKNGSEGICERRFLPDALRTTQIIDPLPLPGSAYDLTLQVNRGLLDKSVDVIVQINEPKSDPVSLWQHAFTINPKDLSKRNTLRVTWKDFINLRTVSWNDTTECIDPAACNTVALSVE